MGWGSGALRLTLWEGRSVRKGLLCGGQGQTPGMERGSGAVDGGWVAWTDWLGGQRLFQWPAVSSYT